MGNGICWRASYRTTSGIRRLSTGGNGMNRLNAGSGMETITGVWPNALRSASSLTAVRR